jgi:hypothetical protein
MIRKKRLPDAVFAVNDLFALSVCREIWAQGIRIPGDIAVIVVDEYLWPLFQKLCSRPLPSRIPYGQDRGGSAFGADTGKTRRGKQGVILKRNDHEGERHDKYSPVKY